MIGPADVCLAWVHGGTVRAEFMESVLGVLASEPGLLVGRYTTFTAGPHIAVARNAVTEAFLAGGPEGWLWMVDTDITFDPGLLPALAAAAHPDRRPVLSGVYWRPGPSGPIPVLYDRRPGRDPEFVPLRTVPAAGVIEVGGCGAGCLLIHRAVLEAIAKTGQGWWTETPTRAGGITGEDLAFCRRVHQAGYQIRAHLGARCGHVKTVTIGPE